MKKNHSSYVQHILLPCLLFSAVTGILTGLLIFGFKYAAARVLELSGMVYGFVRANPAYLPLLLLGAVTVASVAWLLLRTSPYCRGGGIPTVVAILRGLITFRWIRSIFFLLGSTLATFLVGVPLGNEGPSVQMGTALGRATVRFFAKTHGAWDRYIMTGGASAGFAAATGAPVTGIFFVFEEAHRRFSPMIFLSAATAALSAAAVMQTLCDLTSTPYALFHFEDAPHLPVKFLYAALIVGIVCGVCAVFFTKGYNLFRRIMQNKLASLPFFVKLTAVFVTVALIGFFSAECIGSGHDLIDMLMEGEGVWYLLILYFLVRALLFIVSNNVGVSGGLFIPTLTFGAILGALCAKGMIALSILPPQYYPVMVLVGMASFFAASARTPITAIVFAIEAFYGLNCLLPIAIGVTLAYMVIETFRVPSYNELVMEAHVEEANHGKIPHVVDTHLTVAPNAFVVGKEIRDILWPPSCVILGVKKSALHHHGHSDLGIGEGDILQVHYRTFDPEKTAADLEDLVGKQIHSHTRAESHPDEENNRVPEI